MGTVVGRTLGLRVGGTVGAQEGIVVGITGGGRDGDAEGANDGIYWARGEAGVIWWHRGSVVNEACHLWVRDWASWGEGWMETTKGWGERGCRTICWDEMVGGRSKAVMMWFCLDSGKCLVERRSGRVIDEAPSYAYRMLEYGFLCRGAADGEGWLVLMKRWLLGSSCCLVGCLNGHRKVCSSAEVEAFCSVASQVVEGATYCYRGGGPIGWLDDCSVG
jgi:hypothetical protein